jgi:hypothetical protein
MKEKSTKKFDAINKNATVGTRSKILVFDHSVPKRNGAIKKSASIKPSGARPKPRKCSGCSRTRKRG